jgi:hypothetical protein
VIVLADVVLAVAPSGGRVVVLAGGRAGRASGKPKTFRFHFYL